MHGLLFFVSLSLGRSLVRVVSLSVQYIAHADRAVSGCLFPIPCPQAISAVK